MHRKIAGLKAFALSENFMDPPREARNIDSHMGKVRGYREDIDWLRAIAVLAVVAFHFEVPGIWAGYVGVDIFFVISGYLITGILTSEMAAGNFTLTAFYERRLRRLLPALYAMVALTTLPAFAYLLASERAEFFRSITAVVTFTSNIFFWLQSSYFDHAAVEKPLLHTWSLAVEEQFYLAFPLLLWGLSRASKSRAVHACALGGLALLSLGMGIWLMHTDQAAMAFFMSPPRAWEFLIGSVLALPVLSVPKSSAARAIAKGVAAVLFAVGVFGLRKESPYPGLNALLPCSGAVLFIWSGIGVVAPARHQYSPLRVLAFFGKISYSLYLWHWPLFTFLRFSKVSLTLDGFDKALLFPATVTISYVSWKYIEQPFRQFALAKTRRQAFRLASASSLLLILGSLLGLLGSRALIGADPVAAKLDSYSDGEYAHLYNFRTCFDPAGGVFDKACLRPAPDKTNVLLWGDSLAAHYILGLKAAADPDTINFMQATQPACMPTLSANEHGVAPCAQFARQMQEFFRDHHPNVVVIAADWPEYFRRGFDLIIEDLKRSASLIEASGSRVVVLGPAVQFKGRLPAMLLRAHFRGVEVDADDLLLPSIFEIDLKMKAALPNSENFSYVSVLDTVCPHGQCPLTVGDGAPLTVDHAHYTAEGSLFAGAKLLPELGLKRKKSPDAPKAQPGPVGSTDTLGN
jgi:peptidoglycan/LPS O-acetylase OafA/YrhL